MDGPARARGIRRKRCPLVGLFAAPVEVRHEGRPGPAARALPGILMEAITTMEAAEAQGVNEEGTQTRGEILRESLLLPIGGDHP